MLPRARRDRPSRRCSDGLGRLVEAELLYQRGRPPGPRYMFKHALVQDAAYQSLLKRTRQHYHRQVAELLESRFPEVVEAQPELLAHHYTEAGSADQAVTYWQRAGEEALQRSANPEATAHLAKGLEVLRALPDDSERARRELDLLTHDGPRPARHQGHWGAGSGACLSASAGAVPAVGRHAQGSFRRCTVSGTFTTTELSTTPPAASPSNSSRWPKVDRTTVSISRSTDRLVIAYSSSASSRRVERAWSGPSPLTIPRSMAITLFAMAVPIPAWVPCRSVHGVSGRSAIPIRRLVKMRQGPRSRPRAGTPLSEAWALTSAAVVHQLRGEPEAAMEHAEAAAGLAHERGVCALCRLDGRPARLGARRTGSERRAVARCAKVSAQRGPRGPVCSRPIGWPCWRASMAGSVRRRRGWSRPPKQ